MCCKICDKTCSTCGTCVGWDDQGYGVGEYICCIPDSELPECDGNGDCPAWLSENAVSRPHCICFRLKEDAPIGVLNRICHDYGEGLSIEPYLSDEGIWINILLGRRACWEFIAEFKDSLLDIYDKYAKDSGIDYVPKEALQ